MYVLKEKLKEVLISVTPIILIVLLLNFTIAPVQTITLIRFLIGSVAVIIGLALLLLGIEIGIQPFGSHMGRTLLRSNKLWFVIIIGLIMGFFVNIAEPDLHVLASQVAKVTGGHISSPLILITVSLGTGIMLALGVARILKTVPLNLMFAVIYGAITLLSIFASADMLAIGFDASGATTGALTVPLVLAMAVGIAAMEKNSKASEQDSFGLVGIMSTGAIVGVLALNLFLAAGNTGADSAGSGMMTDSLFGPFLEKFPGIALESVIALLPMIILLFIFQKLSFKETKRAFARMLAGFVYTYIGLTIFLTGVSGGFMKAGNEIGIRLAAFESTWILAAAGFALGMCVILTEPAVYILTGQIEDVTSGYIKKKTVLATLSIGVAFAVGLSMLRISLPGIKLWHYLLPGYLISLTLMFLVPKIFVGIAFDSGGVASGPMTATFVLAVAQGASERTAHADILTDSFGVIAMVAMTPLIALQVLGMIYKLKSKKNGG